MNLQVIKNRIQKILAYTVAGILFLLISAFLVIQMPPVQNRLIGGFLKEFSHVTGFKASIKSFRMLWFDRLELEDVVVYDLENNKMISVKKLLINFKASQLLHQNDVNIDGVFLDSAQVLLTKINESDTSRDLNFNVFIAKINEHYAGSGSGGGKTPKLNIGEAILNQSAFTYINQDQDSIKSGFDYNHFKLNIDEGQLKSFMLLGDTIEFDVRTLLAEDQETKLNVKQFSSFFRISQKGMEFIGIKALVGKSIISDTIIFNYDSQLDLNDFVENVNVHAVFKNTVINPNDLALFMPGAEKLKKPFWISGIFNGRINNFKLTKMELGIDNTKLVGSLEMDGLPIINETFINVNLRKSKLDPADLAFLFTDDVNGRLAPLGIVNLDGQFLGYPNDFVANGNFSGKLGAIKSDINFKINEENIEKSSYSGKLGMNNFKLGQYLNDTINFQDVTLDGKIVGSGLTLQTADFQLEGKITSVGIRNYNYKNIATNAHFASELFSGFLRINDPNLQFNARGSIDLRGRKNLIKIQATLDTANLYALHISKDHVVMSTKLDINIKGLSLDSLIGTANLNDFFIQYKEDHLNLPSIALLATRDKQKRSLSLKTSLVDIEANGDYYFSDLYKDISTLLVELSLKIKNDKQAIISYYAKKNSRPKSYQANIKVNLKNVKPVVSLLHIDLELSPNTLLEGRFTSGYTTILQGYTNIKSISYQGNTFLQSDIEFTTSKIADSTSILSMASVNSEKQNFGSGVKTKNLLAEAIWNNSHIDIGLDAEQDGQDNKVRLKGYIDFLKDSTTIKLLPSQLLLLERNWNFAADNFITIIGKEWNVHNVSLENKDQSIVIKGRVSNDPSKILSFSVNQLDLAVLNVLTNQNISGILNADIRLNNYYENPSVENDIQISNLKVNDFLIGDVIGKNKWDTLSNRFDINFMIDRLQLRTVNISGHYDPLQTKSPLNVTASLEKANLKLIEPFMIGIFSQIGGTISGDFTLKGQLNAPEINGEGKVSEGQLMVDYLKTMYLFTGYIGLTPGSVYFKDIVMTDAFQHKGKLKGAIYHKNFNSMIIDLKANFQNFQVLNTTLRDNSLFYGQAYASGELDFSGPISNLSIKANARTEKNTRVYIPIGGTSEVVKKDFINFVNLSDTTHTEEIDVSLKNKLNLTGLTFELNLDVTPDAYCEIIIDLKAGDIIRGRGNGDLKLQLDTKGEFNMFGPFVFTEGWYNFTLYDIINKEFHIAKGSKITWYGDPYQGIMDINASYNQMASFAPIITDITVSSAPQLKRRYPAQVALKLEGQMLSPQFTFDITAKDLPKSIQTDTRTVNLDFEFTAFKNKMDEQELKRQVFSLIILRRFSPPESFNTSGSVVNSVSELLSNQLSYWMSQMDQNLEINVDLGTMDQEAFNTFQLRFSYTFLNGRLRVTGDGTFNNGSQASTTNPNPSTVAGDWTVDYMLTADGKLRVKMFNRTNVNPITATTGNSQNVNTTGASLIYTQTFNRLKDIWRSNRKKQEEEDERQRVNQTEAIKEEEGGE